LLGRSRVRWEDSIRKDIKEIGYENWGLLEFKLFVMLKAMNKPNIFQSAIKSEISQP
jgi:hypothetical protein